MRAQWPAQKGMSSGVAPFEGAGEKTRSAMCSRTGWKLEESAKTAGAPGARAAI